MKKLTKRILSVFLIALLVCTLLPMGAFAEEVAEPQTEEVAEQKAVVVDAVAEQALGTGETQKCTFQILYLDDSTLGYNYGYKEQNVKFICQYKTSHSDTAYNNHTIANSDIKAWSEANASQVKDGYKIVGWTKTVSANPGVNKFSTVGASSCNKGDTIYIVAEKTTPAPVEVTYTVKYVDTDGSEAAETQTATNTDGSAKFTVNDVNAATEAKHAGQNFIGWMDVATGVTYQPDETITVSNPTTVNLTEGPKIAVIFPFGMSSVRFL